MLTLEPIATSTVTLLGNALLIALYFTDQLGTLGPAVLRALHR